MADFYQKIQLPGEAVDGVNRVLAAAAPVAGIPVGETLDGPYQLHFENGFTGAMLVKHSDETGRPVIHALLYGNRGQVVGELTDMPGPINRPIEMTYQHDKYTFEIIREANLTLAEDNAAAYVNSNGEICPFCGATREDFSPSRPTSPRPGRLEQEMLCCSCSGSWTEQYVLRRLLLDQEAWSPPRTSAQTEADR